MITIYSYNIAEGTMESPSVDQLAEVLESDNVDVWVDMEAPTAMESDILSSIFHFHELAIEDCTAMDIEEAKLDDYENYLFMVFHSVFFNREALRFDIIELDMFFGVNYVVTYHKKPTVGIMRLKKRLEAGIDFMGQGTDEILHAIIDSLVDYYTVSFKHVERAILKIEAELLSEPSKKTLSDLFRLKRGLINMRRILSPAEEAIDSLGTEEHELIQEENKVYFQDIHDHISTIQGLLQTYMELVNSTMDTYMSLQTHRMNSNMQVLTIIATLVLIPTLIASIYGMNIPLPFQNNPYSFEIIASINVLLALGMLLFFKKKDWF